MSNKIYPIYHEGKKIYFTDWSNLKIDAEALAAIEETTSFIEQLGEYDLLEIIDVTDSNTPAKAMGLIIESANRTKKFSKRKAIVGVSGMKLMILKAVNQFVDGNIRGFASLEEAKNWIVEE